MAKVWDCIGRVLSQQDGNRMLEMVEGLEKLDDITELMALLGQTPA